MKKLIALALAVMLLASMAVSVSAESTTTLTATVPAASYTLNIPANQEIPFGATSTDIGKISVTDGVGFASGKNLNVSISYSPFTATGVSTQIPYSIILKGKISASSDTNEIEISSGDTICFLGKTDGTVAKYPKSSFNQDYYDLSVLVKALSADWGKALAGEYTSTITFTAEVVVEG